MNITKVKKHIEYVNTQSNKDYYDLGYIDVIHKTYYPIHAAIESYKHRLKPDSMRRVYKTNIDKSFNILKFIIENGANVNQLSSRPTGALSSEDTYPLAQAAGIHNKQNFELVQLLLKHGAKVNQGKYSALSNALASRTLGTAELLLDSGSDMFYMMNTYEGWRSPFIKLILEIEKTLKIENTSKNYAVSINSLEKRLEVARSFLPILIKSLEDKRSFDLIINNKNTAKSSLIAILSAFDTSS